MAVIPTTSNTHSHDHNHRRRHRKKEKKTKPVASATSSWEHFKSLLSCRSIAPSQAHDPSAGDCNRNAKVGPSICGGSICALRNVVHGNTRVVHHNHHSPAASCGPHEMKTPLVGHHPPPPRGGMQLRKLSGCYECHAISVEPLSRYPRPRTLCACSDCGEVFTKPDSLELHRNLRHAVSELGPEDSGRNIVEIIFKSSWQKQDRPICTIERILKVHNTQRTISRFEDYRDSVKAKSAAKSQQNPKKDPRCAADGNELLRFHCAALSCPLGARGSAALCISSSSSSSSAAADPCGVCSVIRHGFSRAPQCPRGVGTTASSGRAHDLGPAPPESRRAMLVCRVIAGRIRRSSDDQPAADGGGGGGGCFDSVGTGANLEELFVTNPRAILPCFVVIYRTLD